MINFNISGIEPSEFFGIEPNFVSPENSLSNNVNLISVSQNASVYPNGAGYARWSGNYDYVLKSKEERFEFIEKFKTLNGPIESFWLPSWSNDFNATQNILSGQASLSYTENGFKYIFDTFSDQSSAYTNPNVQVTVVWALMVLFGSTAQVRRITGVPSNGLLQVSSPWTTTFSKDSIDLISLVRRVRLSSTSIKLDHLSDSVCESALKFIEVIGEHGI